MGTGTILLVSLLAVVIIWGTLEAKTLADKIPNNHITAVVRAAFKAQPGPFFLLGYALGFFSGHFFWW